MLHKPLLALCLLPVLMLNIGRYQLPQLEYILFKGYIARNYCVQKNNVHNCCQGKCFLHKQMASANDQDTSDKGQAPERKNHTTVDGSDCIESPVSEMIFYPLNTRFRFAAEHRIRTTSPAFSIFVPPWF